MRVKSLQSKWWLFKTSITEAQLECIQLCRKAPPSVMPAWLTSGVKKYKARMLPSENGLTYLNEEIKKEKSTLHKRIVC